MEPVLAGFLKELGSWTSSGLYFLNLEVSSSDNMVFAGDLLKDRHAQYFMIFFINPQII